MNRLLGVILGLMTPICTAAMADTDGRVSGKIDAHEIDIQVRCSWTDDATLGIKSHEFIMLSKGFKERPALQMNFYNNSYFLILLIGDDAYQMVDQNGDGSLTPGEVYHHKGAVAVQSGHEEGYEFDLVFECPKE